MKMTTFYKSLYKKTLEILLHFENKQNQHE